MGLEGFFPGPPQTSLEALFKTKFRGIFHPEPHQSPLEQARLRDVLYGFTF